MDIDTLFDLQDEERLSERERQCVKALVAAMTDWPTEVKTVEEYFREVKQFLKVDTLTYAVVEEALKGLSPAHYGWQMESLAELMKMEVLNDHQALDENWVEKLVVEK